MSDIRMGPGVTMYGVPAKYQRFCVDKPGWWFFHRDQQVHTEDLIRVENEGPRFRAIVDPITLGTAATKRVLGTYATMDDAHRAAVEFIAARDGPRLTKPADIDAVRGLFPDAAPTARFK